MTRRASILLHFPARADTTNNITTYTAMCSYVSTDKAEFCDPAKHEKTTCGECRNYDRLKNAETWTQSIQVERE